MSYKPYLKRENKNIVVLIEKRTPLRCTEEAKELTFDRTQNAGDILDSLREQIKGMKGVKLITRTDENSFVTHLIVDIQASESNNAPRFVVLTLGKDPFRVKEVETYMRTYGINLDDAFDISLNLSTE